MAVKLTPDLPSNVVWAPQLGPQTLLLTCPFNEILYGGARGGGKTDGMLGKALQQAAKYGKASKSIIFRQSFGELEDLIDRSREIYGRIGGRYWPTKRMWVMPGGATIKMRYLDRPSTASKYQGHAHTFVGVDEVGNWESPAGLDMLRGILRSAQGVPVTLMLTANPGGKGHKWLKARYIEGKKAFTGYYNPETEFTSVFIPSKLKDNPALALKDPTYEKRLKASGPAWLVKAWLEGDWDAQPDVEGALWNSAMLDKQRVKRLPEGVELQEIVVGVDPSVTGGEKSDETGIVVVGMGTDGRAYILEDASLKGIPPTWGATVRKVYFRWNANRIIAEVNQGGDMVRDNIRATTEEGGEDIPVKTVRAKNSKQVRAEPVSSLFENDKVRLVGHHTDLEFQMTTWVPGVAGQKSPDRMEAMVYAVTYLLVKAGVVVWEA